MSSDSKGEAETYRCDKLGAGRLEIFLLLEDEWGAVGGGRRGGAEERRGFVVVEGVHGAAGGRRRDRERAQTGHALAGRTLGRRLGALGGCQDMESKVNINDRVSMYGGFTSGCWRWLSLQLLCRAVTTGAPSGRSREGSRTHNWRQFREHIYMRARKFQVTDVTPLGKLVLSQFTGSRSLLQM